MNLLTREPFFSLECLRMRTGLAGGSQPAVSASVGGQWVKYLLNYTPIFPNTSTAHIHDGESKLACITIYGVAREFPFSHMNLYIFLMLF